MRMDDLMVCSRVVPVLSDASDGSRSATMDDTDSPWLTILLVAIANDATVRVVRAIADRPGIIQHWLHVTWPVFRHPFRVLIPAFQAFHEIQNSCASHDGCDDGHRGVMSLFCHQD